MPGLLDSDPLSTGLLSIGSALLTPVSRGGGFAAVPGALLQAQQMAREEAKQKQALDLQKAHMALYQAQADKLAEQDRRQSQLQEMIRQRLAGQGGPGAASAAEQALTQGAAVGDIGPTRTNAQRMDAITSGGAPQSFPFSLPEVLQIKAMGGPDMLEAYKFASTPQKREGGSYYVDPITGRQSFYAKPGDGMRPTADGRGFEAIPGYRQINADNKGAETAAVETAKLPAFQRQEQIRASLDPFPYVGPNGEQFTTNRLSALGGGAGVSGLPMLGGGAPGAGVPGATPGGIRTGLSPADRKQQEAIAGDWAETYKSLQNAGMTATGQLSRMNRAMSLLEGAGGGRWSPTFREASSIAASLGIKLDPKLGDKQAAEALAVEMATNMRKPGTGTMTDRDFENFRAAVPDLAKTPEGRQQIFVTMKGLLERDRTEADMARKYRQRYGRIDEDFFNQLDAWRSRNPVFQAPDMARPGATGSF